MIRLSSFPSRSAAHDKESPAPSSSNSGKGLTQQVLLSVENDQSMVAVIWIAGLILDEHEQVFFVVTSHMTCSAIRREKILPFEGTVRL